MMSADDEPQIRPSIPDIKLTNPLNTNTLINEAFNISTSIGSIQPLMVLPPSSNHFQPIHSRTPSTEVKDISSNMFKHSPSQTNTLNFNNSPASFFDQKTLPPPTGTNNLKTVSPQINPLVLPPSLINIENKVQAPSLIPPPSQLLAPIPTKPLQFPIPTLTPLINPQLASTIAPPLSLPPPPPSSSVSASSGANPYSAKGALNKKVYDTGVPVVSLPPPSLPLGKLPEVTETSSNAFMNNSSMSMPLVSPPIQPPMLQTMDSSSMLFQPPVQSAQSSNVSSTSFNNFQVQNPGQPIMNLNERFTSSLTINSNNNVNNNNNNGNNTYNNSNGSSDAQNKTMWNWLTKNRLVNTFVEKVVTTVDPQMREFIHPANQPFLLVTPQINLAHQIRESFTNAGFSKITLNLLETTQSSQNVTQFAPQIVGFPCALQSVKEKIDTSLAFMQQTECVILSFQDFLVELTTDCWFEMAVVLLKDKVNNIDLTVYTEAIPVSSGEIAQLQQMTPHDYHLKWSGFSVRLPEKNFNFNQNTTVLSYDSPDILLSQSRISHAIKTIALLFKKKLISKMQG